MHPHIRVRIGTQVFLYVGPTVKKENRALTCGYTQTVELGGWTQLYNFNNGEQLYDLCPQETEEDKKKYETSDVLIEVETPEFSLCHLMLRPCTRRSV